jgi:xanthine dehydrogenase large subunit
MYGIGAYFAIRNAIKAFTDCSPKFDAPFTAERVLLNLYKKPVFSSQ